MKTIIYGKELLAVIESLGELEWMRFRNRYPEVQIKGELKRQEDRSSYFPYTSFRFQNECADIVNNLQQALACYSGAVEWILISQKREFGNGVNRCVLPKHVQDMKIKARVFDIHIDDYMARFEPAFSPKAFEDLVKLSKHVKSFFEGPGFVFD